MGVHPSMCVLLLTRIREESSKTVLVDFSTSTNRTESLKDATLSRWNITCQILGLWIIPQLEATDLPLSPIETIVY